MSQVTYIEAIRQAMEEEMKRDPSVFILGEDVGVYGGAFKATVGLQQEFGEWRVIDTPLSESAIVGAAIGAALMGMRPVAEMQFADFIACAFDQIVNVAAKMRYRTGNDVPLVIRAPFGAGVHGGPFHSQSPEAWFFHTPGLKIVAPATAYDAKGLLKAAIRDDDPVIYFEHLVLLDSSGPVPEDDYVVPLGKAEIARDGKDATVVSIGRMRQFALQAADELAAEGIQVEVVDPQSLSPLDEGTILESVKKTHRLVVVDEDNPRCSVANDIVALAAQQAFGYLDAPPQAVTAPHTPVPFSPPLEDAYIPSPAKIAAAVRAVMS